MAARHAGWDSSSRWEFRSTGEHPRSSHSLLLMICGAAPVILAFLAWRSGMALHAGAPDIWLFVRARGGAVQRSGAAPQHTATRQVTNASALRRQCIADVKLRHVAYIHPPWRKSSGAVGASPADTCWFFRSVRVLSVLLDRQALMRARSQLYMNVRICWLLWPPPWTHTDSIQ